MSAGPVHYRSLRRGSAGRVAARGVTARTGPPRSNAWPGAATLAAALLCAVGVLATAGSAPSPPHPAGPVVAPGNPAVQLQGRWDRAAWADTTVNSGSRMFLRFTGRRIAAMIAATARGAQFFSRIDGGPPVLHDPAGLAGGGGDGQPGSYGAPGAGYGIVNLAPRPLAPGTHTVEIDVKDVDGGGDRWSPPLRSAFVLTGLVLDRGAKAVAPAVSPAGAASRRILFLGDSITEGIRSAGPQLGQTGADATMDYAWLTGRAFGADFSQVGFGGQGIFHRGDGGVPPAPATLRYNYRGSPASSGFTPQVVVVNQGTNDHVRSARFTAGYLSYLREIRAAWPRAWILALRPFGGTHAADIAAAVKAGADPRTRYVDTTGWLRPDEFTDGLHPSFAGHLNVAHDLEPVIAAVTGWRFGPTPSAACQLIPVGHAGATVQVSGGPPAVEAARGRPVTAAGGPWAVAARHPGTKARVQWPGAQAPGRWPGTHAPGSRPPQSRSRWWAGRYGGEPILAAAPANAAGRGTVAAPSGWRAVRVEFGRPVSVPPSARDLFVYLSVPHWAARAYAVRLTITSGRGSRSTTAAGIPVFDGFLPWARVHIGLGGWRGPLAGLTIGVHGDEPRRGNLPFLVTAVGWTDQPDG